MSRWIDQLRAVWQRIFFWQKPSGASAEQQPHAHDDHALVLAVSGTAKVPLLKQLRFIQRILPPIEWKIFWIAGCVVLAGLAVGTADIGRAKLIRVPAKGGIVTEGLVGSPKLINPLYASLNDVDRDISSLVYSGLFRLDDTLEPVPDLAESYRWSEDGKTLEVTLREDVRFHDNEPLTANDVEFTYKAIKNPAWRSPLASMFRNATVVRVDDRIVQFQLEAPDPTFLSELTVGILPAHIWSQVPETSAQLADANIRPVGSGPYQVVSFTRDSKGVILNFHLERFDRYYGLAPYIAEWRFRFYPDRASAEEGLRNNQIDALAFVPWAEVTDLKTENLQTTRIELPQKTIAFFNVKDSLLKDTNMRKALTLAVDGGELAELLGSQSRVSPSPFPFDTSVTGTPADLEQARTLLDGLDWVLNEGDGLRYKKGASTSTEDAAPLSLAITVPNQPDLLNVAELLQRRWSLIGIEVAIRSGEAQPLLDEAITNRNYQVLIWNVLLSPKQDLNPFWNSSQTSGRGLNFSNIEDRDLDAALSNIKTATTTEGLLQKKNELSQAIVGRYPALFLFEPSYAYLLSKRIQGVEALRIARPSDRFWNAATWYVKTRWSWQ